MRRWRVNDCKPLGLEECSRSDCFVSGCHPSCVGPQPSAALPTDVLEVVAIDCVVAVRILVDVAAAIEPDRRLVVFYPDVVENQVRGFSPSVHEIEPNLVWSEATVENRAHFIVIQRHEFDRVIGHRESPRDNMAEVRSWRDPNFHVPVSILRVFLDELFGAGKRANGLVGAKTRVAVPTKVNIANVPKTIQVVMPGWGCHINLEQRLTLLRQIQVVD